MTSIRLPNNPNATGNQRELRFNRDLTGRIERITQVDWRYQAPAYVTTATDLATVSHLPFGPRTTVTEVQTPGFQTQRHFDTDFQQDQLTVTRGAATLQDQLFTWDAGGNRVGGVDKMAHSAIPQHLEYDALDRLKLASSELGTLQFTYDAIGNRLNLTRTPEQTVYHYALDSQRLLQETGPVTRSFAFNPVGSVVQAGGDRYVYDPEQRLLQVLRGTTTVADYRYDAFGQRSRKTAASVTTHYQYDPDGRLLAETNLQGTLLRQYVYFDDGQPFATYDGTKLAFLATDPIGMPTLAVNRSGATLWRNRYEAFGESTPNATGLTLNLRFPGQYHDSETGLHYNLHRYYDPSLGRYLQADLIGLAGGVGLYGYVGNNPLTGIDPDGLIRIPFPWGPTIPIVPTSPGSRGATGSDSGQDSTNGSSSMSGGRDWGRANGRGRFECVIRFDGVEIAGSGQGKGNSGCCPSWIHGWGLGNSPDEAWNNAFQAANANTPPGCQKRHPRGIFGSCKGRQGGKAK